MIPVTWLGSLVPALALVAVVAVRAAEGGERETQDQVRVALSDTREPGPTSDWDADLAARLRSELAADGIDVDALDDRALVEQVSVWFLQRARYQDSFTTFVTAFDEHGQPFVPEELAPHVGAGVPPTAKAWSREISARGMFEHRTRGSCSSSAIYLSGCLRALGIPTRTVLCIPLFDAGDERRWELVREGLREPSVRRAVLSGMRGLAPR